jgi:hypothetical protein
MKALLALLLLAASSDPATSVVYSRYQSGRPRLVVKATHDPDELLLLRYADAPHARGRVVARQELDSRPGEVLLEKVIDAKDVVVWCSARHGEYGIVNRIIGDRFVRITDSYGDAVDLDGDGVPEIIGAAYAGQNECGVASYVWLHRWNGKKFVDDGHKYVTALSNQTADDEVLLSEDDRYVVRLFGRGSVTLDGDPVAAGKPFQTDNGCHTIALHGATAKTRALLEELP